MFLRSALGSAVIALVVVAFSGCCNSAPNVGVHVDCKLQKDGAHCAVKETEGKAKAKVCWDVHLVCKNGSTVTGPGCVNVDNGGSFDHLIPNTELEGEEKCDVAEKMTINNIKITS